MKKLNHRPRALDHVHVNIPLAMLAEGHLELFLRNRLAPEIGLDGRALDAFDRSACADFALALSEAELPVTVHGPFIDLSPGAIDPRILAVTRERFAQLIDRAEVFRPEVVVVHADYQPLRHFFYYDQWLETTAETFGPVLEGVGAMGARLAVENTFEDTPKPLLDLLERLPGAGICLDPGHVSAFSKTPLDPWIEALGPRITHLHLHDNDGTADWHWGLGRGTIELRKLFDYLTATRAPEDRPSVTLEPHTEQDFLDGLPGLEGLWPAEWR